MNKQAIAKTIKNASEKMRKNAIQNAAKKAQKYISKIFCKKMRFGILHKAKIAFLVFAFFGIFLQDFALASEITKLESLESSALAESKESKEKIDSIYNPLQVKIFDSAISSALILLEKGFGALSLESYATPLVLRVVLSVIAFLFLWFFRRILTRFAMWLISLSFHLAKQDVEANNKIQSEIIKPVSLFLFLLSFDINISILYYPHLSPKELEKWFGVSYVVNFGWFIILALRGYAAIFINAITQKNGTQHFRKEVLNLLLKIAYFFIIIIVILWILKILGFNISAIIASLGLGGLAVALAVKDMLANFFASVMLLFDNSFSQGDRIECGGINGVVVEMGLRRTTIRTSDNALVLIPNSELANKSITNWSRRKAGRLIKISIGLTYDTSRDQIIKCAHEIKKMLLNHPKIAQSDDEKEALDFSISFKQDIISVDDYLGYKANIYVVLDELADSSINILVYCFSKAISYEGYLLAKEEILLEIMQIIESQGLSFAFPSQSLYFEKMPKEILQNQAQSKTQNIDTK